MMRRFVCRGWGKMVVPSLGDVLPESHPGQSPANGGAKERRTFRDDGLFRGEVSARRPMTVDDEYYEGERRCDRMSHRHQ